MQYTITITRIYDYKTIFNLIIKCSSQYHVELNILHTHTHTHIYIYIYKTLKRKNSILHYKMNLTKFWHKI